MKEKIHLLQNMLYGCEGIALLSGIIAWKYIKDKKIRYFVCYLLFIVFSEQVGNYLGRHGYKSASVMFYNYLVIPAEFIFAYWFLHAHLEKIRSKSLLWGFSSGCLIASVLEYTLLKDERFFFSSFSYVVSALFLLILILLFLWQFIKTDKLINYDRYFVFWVAVAFLIYYLGTFPLYIFYNYLYSVNKKVFYIYWETQMYLNMLMYLLFSVGILWTNLKYKPS